MCVMPTVSSLNPGSIGHVGRKDRCSFDISHLYKAVCDPEHLNVFINLVYVYWNRGTDFYMEQHSYV